VPYTLVFGWTRWIQTMMQIYASAGKLQAAAPILLFGIEAMFDREQPPPRIVVGVSALASAVHQMWGYVFSMRTLFLPLLLILPTLA
jgi:hypothetical protein